MRLLTSAIPLTLVLSLGMLAQGCATNAAIPKSTAGSRPLISSIELSHDVGHVGQQFESEIDLHAQRLGKAEFRIDSLPPGLRYDKKSQSIVGIPKADGFYSVTVKVRKKRGRGIHFNTPDGAWFSEHLQIDIYKPVVDGSDGAWQGDMGVAAADL